MAFCPSELTWPPGHSCLTGLTKSLPGAPSQGLLLAKVNKVYCNGNQRLMCLGLEGWGGGREEQRKCRGLGEGPLHSDRKTLESWSQDPRIPQKLPRPKGTKVFCLIVFGDAQ